MGGGAEPRRIRRGGPPTPNEFDPAGKACIRQGARLAASISGPGDAPDFVDRSPPGIGRLIPGRAWHGLNPHYGNEFAVPIQVKVWINMHPVEGTLRLRFFNQETQPIHIYAMSSHQHQRSARFTAWGSDGTKPFENDDWVHPAIRNFAARLIRQPVVGSTGARVNLGSGPRARRTEGHPGARGLREAPRKTTSSVIRSRWRAPS